jgi:hypothetical protein
MAIQRRGNPLIPKRIQTEAKNQAALARLDEILDAKPGTPDGEEFELLVLGDPRRTKRLLKVAEGMLDAPDQSLPSQFNDWSDLKAVYRLLRPRCSTV